MKGIDPRKGVTTAMTMVAGLEEENQRGEQWEPAPIRPHSRAQRQHALAHRLHQCPRRYQSDRLHPMGSIKHPDKGAEVEDLGDVLRESEVVGLMR